MSPKSSFLLAACLLAACSADPSGTNNGAGSVDNTAPTAVAGNVVNVDYDPSRQELVLSINAIHGNARNVTYTRTPALDTAGYQAYTQQSTPADRHYTALFKGSNDNRLIAGVVMDGGNDNRFFGGGIYARQGAAIYSPYTNNNGGEAQYYGTYAGVTNVSGNGAQLKDASGLPSNITAPRQSDRVSGIILLNADFANGAVDGEISNRRLADNTGNLPALTDLILTDATIASDGSFKGTVEYEGSPKSSIGEFSGLFGGSQATSAAGAVALTEFSPSITNEAEYGVFVLTRCGASGADPACAGL
jgi:hypothetical protein